MTECIRDAKLNKQGIGFDAWFFLRIGRKNDLGKSDFVRICTKS